MYWVSKRENREKEREKEGIGGIASSTSATPSSQSLNYVDTSDYVPRITHFGVKETVKKTGFFSRRGACPRI